MSELKQNILIGKNSILDFVIDANDSKRIAIIISAFANTDGGILYVGVKDNGKIVGCLPQLELVNIKKSLELFCDSEINYDSRVIEESHKLILEIKVIESNLKPHKLIEEKGKKQSFIRVDDKNLLVNKIIEGYWSLKKSVEIVPLSLTKEDSKLLSIIEREQPITLSKLYRQANMPLKFIDKTLTILILHQYVAFDFQDENIIFKVNT